MALKSILQRGRSVRNLKHKRKKTLCTKPPLPTGGIYTEIENAALKKTFGIDKLENFFYSVLAGYGVYKYQELNKLKEEFKKNREKHNLFMQQLVMKKVPEEDR